LFRKYQTITVLSLFASALFAQKPFQNGQAARAVIGQFTFTKGDQNPTGQILGGAGGVAYANGKVFVADGNRLGATPIDNRVLVFDATQIPGPYTDLLTDTAVKSLTSCYLCGTPASFGMGQNTFTPPTYTPSGQTTPVTGFYSGHDGGEDQAGSVPAENAWLDNPTAVASDGVHFAIADTDNNRVLLWNSIPTGNQHPDLVIGQPNFSTLQTQALGVVTATAMRGPQGVWIGNNRLYVADTQNNRVLIWNSWPTTNNQTPDVVLGQPDFTHANQPPPTTTSPTAAANQLLRPASVTADGGHVYVSDLGFNRVLIWNTVAPSIDQAADVALGQLNFTETTANNTDVCYTASASSTVATSGGANALPLGTQDQCQSNLNFPRYALSDGTRLFIADSGNDRVLIYNSIPTQNGTLANGVLGQTNFINDIVTSVSISIVSTEVDNTGGVDTTPSPTSLAWDGTNLYVADSYNRRILLFTAGDSLIPSPFDSTANVIPVVNWGSEIVRQEGVVTFSVVSGAKISAGDTATITIAGTAYTTPPETGTNVTVDTIAKQLVAAINKGAGDPNALASFGGAGTGTVYLSSIDRSGAEVTSLAYDTISLSATVSNANDLVATASGSYLSAGNAATGAPGMLVEVNAPPGVFFTDNDTPYVATLNSSANNGQVPATVTGYGVELFIDGFASPLYKITPKQLVGQIPFSYGDRNSSSVYVRTAHNNGTVTVTSATPVYIAPANPGIFSAQQYPGQTRPWQIAQARHQVNGPVAVISFDGSPTLNDVLGVYVNGSTTPYQYTVTSTDTLQSIVAQFVSLMASDPYVIPSAGGSFTRLVLTSRLDGFSGGNGIPIAVATGTTTGGGLPNCTTTSTGSASEELTPYGSAGNDANCHAYVPTCCAVVSGSPIFPGNPAVPGELISIAVAGMGDIQDQNGNDITNGLTTSYPYSFSGQVPFPMNDVTAADFAAATLGQESAQVISAGLEGSSYGIYRVDVLVPTDAVANSQTPFYVAQNAFISNTVYLPVGTAVSNPPSPPPAVPASPINLSIDAPITPQLGSVTTVSGNMTVLGWAIDSATPVSNVAIQIDGITVANLTNANGGYGLPRPDVCVTYPTVFSCPNVGYSYSYDTTNLANGAHNLQVLVTDAAGRNHANPEGVALFVNNDPLASHTHVDIDTPTTLMQIYHGVVLFNGWATNDTSPIVSFKASIDGFPVDPTQIIYGGARPDVCAVAVAGTPGCPNVGWTYLADLTKLANSTQPDGETTPHLFTIEATAANGQKYTVSSPFNVNNYNPIDLFSGPAMTIDTPSATAGTLSGTSSLLFGWAIDNYTLISSVTYSIDGVSQGPIFYGLGRPDVCAAYGNLPNFDLANCPYVGFNGTFDTTQFADGTHVLGITATPAQGQPYTMTRTITIANQNTTANPIRISIDSPAQGASTAPTFSGQASISGWSLTNSPSTATIQSIQVSVDGVAVGTATYGTARPDVCILFAGRPGCPNVGYTYTLDTTRLINGSHVLEITSTSSDGKRATASAAFTVSNVSTTFIVGIDTPNAGTIAVSGIASVKGFAVKPGVAIHSVTIEVDGIPVGTASVNVARPDVCSTYSSPQCPNVGFTYQFDTDALVDGAHVLGVVATAADGTSNSNAALFIVQNWSAGVAMSGNIDSPSSAEPYYTGTNTFKGWFLAPNVSVSNVLISIDGIPYGNATRVSRSDVCSTYSSPDCPNVGWTFSLDTSLLTNDIHTFAATGTTVNGQSFTLTQTFTSEN